MQVIAGKYKGRKLISLDTIETRPTLSRVKESMFAIIDEHLYDARVLDLFAGSGSLGFEALSRGAEEVVFVDNNPKYKNVLEKNLARVTEKHSIIIDNFDSALTRLSKINSKFDVVFLDPPYNSDFGDKAIKLLTHLKLLSKGAIIVYEQDSKKCLQNAPELFIIKKSKKYGLAQVTILEYIGE